MYRPSPTHTGPSHQAHAEAILSTLASAAPVARELRVDDLDERSDSADSAATAQRRAGISASAAAPAPAL